MLQTSFDIFYTIAPAIGALLLSLYNWFSMHRGAVLKPTKGYRFGFIKFQSGRKLIYLPLDVMNNGTKVGKIDNIFYTFNGPNQENFVLKPTKRIKLGSSETPESGITRKNIFDALPTLPLFCPPSEGVSELFEYYEDSEEILIKPNTNYIATLHMIYNGNKKVKMDFNLLIPTEIWDRAGNSIIWVEIDNKSL